MDVKYVDLNFKVSKEFRYRFKNNAARLGVSNKKYLMMLFSNFDPCFPNEQSAIDVVYQTKVSSMSNSEKAKLVAEILAERVAALPDGISLDLIARDLGYRSQDYLNLLIAGEAKLPLHAVERFAEVFKINFVQLAHAALKDWGLHRFATALQPVSLEDL